MSGRWWEWGVNDKFKIKDIDSNKLKTSNLHTDIHISHERKW